MAREKKVFNPRTKGHVKKTFRVNELDTLNSKGDKARAISKLDIKPKTLLRLTPSIPSAIESFDRWKVYMNERELDGAADFFVFRDGGKYGSYSSYDEMGDESNP